MKSIERCRSFLGAQSATAWARLPGLRDRLRGSDVAKGTWFMLLGLGGRYLVQAVYFVVIARALDPDGYGAFVGTLALMIAAVPFASWGTGHVLIQDVARDSQQFARRWGDALLVTTLCGLGLCVLMLGVSRLILPESISLGLIVALALSELFFARLTDLASQAFLAFGQVKRTAVLSVWQVVVRLVAAFAMLTLDRSPTPEHWGFAYVLSSAVAAVAALALVRRELGSAELDWVIPISRLKEGFYFSIGHSAGGIYSEIDKTMLVRLSTLQATGVY
ncbi:MAG: oligosaccharide flippase family protein, partial [Gemmatimonadota bacterium]|nr:oligosaccharide flippase family protein [Gemmatimonadota bacterium]